MNFASFNSIRMAMITAAAVIAMIMPASAEDVNGVWAMTDGKVTVKIARCGGNLCAKIVGLKEPISKIDGKPKVDRENPNASLRKRPLIGLDILLGMKPAKSGVWKGQIYNADDGKTYNAMLTQSGNKISLKACVAAVFCKTSNFVRAN